MVFYMLNGKRVLIFIVAYNANKTIRQLLDRIPKDTLDLAEEILVADDSSQDNTSEIVLDYIKKYNLSKIKIVKHKENKGYGGNQKWGYNYAIQNNFDIVVMVHGDAQYPPEYILRLITPISNGKTSFMFGSRITGHPLKGKMPLYKFIGNKSLTFIENLALRTKLSEFHSGFRAYSVHALREIPFNKNSNDFHFDSEIIVQLVIAKKRMGEISIPTRYGNEKCHVNSIKYGLNVLKVILEYKLHKLKIKRFEKYHIKRTY